MTDQEMEADVRARLCEQRDIDESHVDVRVEDAIVTLTGYVASIQERVAAEVAAAQAAGVLGIANEIQVMPSIAEQIGDRWIVRRAVAAIREEIPRGQPRVRAIVRDRFVTLEGTVDELPQRERIESQVRAIAGIAGVSNLIAITRMAALS